MLTTPRAILGTFVAVHVINDFYATVLPAFLPALAREWDLDYTEPVSYTHLTLPTTPYE